MINSLILVLSEIAFGVTGFPPSFVSFFRSLVSSVIVIINKLDTYIARMTGRFHSSFVKLASQLIPLSFINLVVESTVLVSLKLLLRLFIIHMDTSRTFNERIK